jgi:hypothetical protein
MVQVRIDSITNATTPVSVFISDVYGNYQTLLGTINSTVPPTVNYNSTIPAIFQTAPQIMLTLVDATGCSIFKILDCVFGCAFNITVDLVDCILNISLQETSCVFDIYSTESD